MIRDKHAKELYLIPAAQTRDKNSIKPEQLRDICDRLKEDHDYVIVDCPAGIETGFRNAVAASDSAIVITTPEVSAVRDADRVIGLLEASAIGTPDLVINRVRPKMVSEGDMMDKDDVLGLLSVRIIGVVPDDSQVIVATNKGVPVVHDPKSLSGQAFRRIAARIDGEDVPFLDLDERKGMMSRLMGIFGTNGRNGNHA